MENLNNSWKIEKVAFFKTLTKITKAISNIPSGKSIMQLVYSVSLWGKNVAFSSISKNGISSVLRQTGESQNGCFKKTKQASVKECYMSKRETKKWTIYVAFLAAFYSLRWLWLHCCSSIFTIDLNWCSSTDMTIITLDNIASGKFLQGVGTTRLLYSQSNICLHSLFLLAQWLFEFPSNDYLIIWLHNAIYSQKFQYNSTGFGIFKN